MLPVDVIRRWQASKKKGVGMFFQPHSHHSLPAGKKKPLAQRTKGNNLSAITLASQRLYHIILGNDMIITGIILPQHRSVVLVDEVA